MRKVLIWAAVIAAMLLTLAAYGQTDLLLQWVSARFC